MLTMGPARNKRIRENLDEHFLKTIGVSVATPEPWWWNAYGPQYGPLAPLGWAWPVFNPNATTDESIHPIMIPYCPEIIDFQTTDFSDEALDGYLATIKAVLTKHIILWDEIEDDAARHKEVEVQMILELPEMHTLLQDMLARVVG